MKLVIKEVSLIILALIGAIFFISFIFGKEDEKLSVFDGVTGVVEQMNSKEPKNESVHVLQSEGSTIKPSVKYIGGFHSAGASVVFKDMFEITIEGQTFAGSSGNGFAIYLQDIVDTAGNSRLVSMDSESINANDEIFSDFVYDKEQDILYMYGHGCYEVWMNVYTVNGSSTSYIFTLPVELK